MSKRYIVQLEPGVWLTWPPTNCLISRETRRVEYAARYPSSEMAQTVVDNLRRYPNAKIVEVES